MREGWSERVKNRLPRLTSSVLGVTAVVACAVLVGAVCGGLYWGASRHVVGVSGTIRVVDDTSSLTSVLAANQTQVGQDTGFISGEVARLSSVEFAQQLSAVLHRDVAPLTATQIATSDLAQLSTSDQDADQGVSTLNGAIELYRKGRQERAARDLAADLAATQLRINAMTAVGNRSAADTELGRLLAHQSDLVAAQARLAQMVPVISAPAPMPSAGLGGAVLIPLIGGLLGGLLAALLIAAARLRDRSIRSPSDLTALGYRVLMPVFDLHKRGSWSYVARIILGQLAGVHRGERLLLVAVDPAARADVIADTLIQDRAHLSGPSARRAAALGEGSALEADPEPTFEAIDVRSILTRRNDPSDSAVLVVALGRTRRDWVMGAFRAVNAAGMSCSGVILTTGQVNEEPVEPDPWQHAR